MKLYERQRERKVGVSSQDDCRTKQKRKRAARSSLLLSKLDGRPRYELSAERPQVGRRVSLSHDHVWSNLSSLPERNL